MMVVKKTLFKLSGEFGVASERKPFKLRVWIVKLALAEFSRAPVGGL